MATRNLINLEAGHKAFDIRPLLAGVSLGVNEGERIGIVGRNGGGKSTLLKVLAGEEPLDSGRVAHSGELRFGTLTQNDTAPANATVREVVLGDLDEHEWAGNRRIREILLGLFGGFNEELFARKFHSLSGGERRRVNLAKLLISDLNLIFLDEPTNHLDVEGVAWLAGYLKERRDLAILVITHDRWFLDEVAEQTWEVVDGEVLAYDGGYSAFVLSKAERARQEKVEATKRNMLIRKELAWLRRGAPARTSKPKFRIDAANTLIENEPPIRNATQLLNFAQNRLGKTVYELHQADIEIAGKKLLQDIYWNVGPGDRIGIVGVNGAGKTTLIRTLLEEIPVAGGKLVTGVTVKPAYLSQHLEELDPTWRVLEAVEKVATRVELGDGTELSASQLCEKLGFSPDAQWTPVGDLSGGERRRLQLTRLLMDSPNVLVLDEPTNDFDVETLTSLEDLLDSFGGSLLVISHDRYFLERVCDRFVGLLGDKTLRDLPGGIEEYLALRFAQEGQEINSKPAAKQSNSVQSREARKELQKVERQMAKLQEKKRELESVQASAGSDHEQLMVFMHELTIVSNELEALEERWLELSELTDGLSN